MKRRMIALLLSGIMILQGSSATMADALKSESGTWEVRENTQENEEIPAFSSGNQEADSSETENPTLTEEASDGELSPAFTDGVQEGAEAAAEFSDQMLGNGEEEGVLQFVKDIDWDQKDQTYWDAINWSEISWAGIIEEDENGKVKDGWANIPKPGETNADKIDWSQIDWSSFQWYNGVYFDATKVDWKKVNWSQVDWTNSYILQYDRLDEDGSDAAAELWKNIDWSQIDWDTFDWSMILDASHLDKIQLSEKKTTNGKKGIAAIDWTKVNWHKMDWSVLGLFVQKSYLDYELEFSKNDPDKLGTATVDGKERTILTTDIKQVTDGEWTENAIDPVDVALKIIPDGEGGISIDSEYYRVILDSMTDKDENGNKRVWYPLRSIQAVDGEGVLSGSGFYISNEEKYKKFLVKKLEKPLQPLGSSYWDIMIDDTECTYASDASKKPKVTIIGEDGECLEEGKDYTYHVIGEGSCETRESKIKISTVEGSQKVDKSEITKRYTIHYADINEYYELKNVQNEILYLDALKTGDLLLSLKQEYDVTGRKLPLKEDEKHLSVHFSYDGKTWTDVSEGDGGFHWSDWSSNKKRTEEAVWIKVSIKGNDKHEGYYPNEVGGTGGMSPRYIDGEIIRKILVKPYSLSEKDFEYPTTYSTGNLEGAIKTELPTTLIRFESSQHFAVVNPTFKDEQKQEVNGEDIGIGYNTIEGNLIEEVTYNGKEQEPKNVKLMVCEYGNFSLGPSADAIWTYRNETFAKPDYEYEVEYANNIDAGTAEMTFTFLKNFTGSVKRRFKILPKNIADDTVSVEAMDFVQDGKPHEPKLTVIDTESGKVLDADDYTYEVVDGSTTNSGTVTVKISGKNNEKGEGAGNYYGDRTVKYKIHSTQTGGNTYIPGLGDASHYEIALEPVTYNGQKQLPKVTVKNLSTGKNLEINKDFKVEHAAGADNTNAGIGKVKITGLRISGTIQKGFLIRAKEFDSSITIQTKSAIHNGKPQIPETLITDTQRKAVLSAEKDYSLYAKAGSDNVNVGTGQIVVRGNGNYTGSATVGFEIIKNVDEDGNIHNADGSVQTPDGTYLSPAKTMLNWVKVSGNRADIRMNSHANGAEGYDFVIGTSKDMLKTKDYVKVNKNQLSLQTSMYYIKKGTYYAACHAWMKDKNGKKVFGPWSELMRFEVKAVTPQTPKITGVKTEGNTVTVTYTRCANAIGYDIVLGTQVRKVNGELRPVQYGNLVKKVTGKNRVTAVFSDVKSGTYYAGVHAYNRTSANKTKVFSPWSETVEVKIGR